MTDRVDEVGVLYQPASRLARVRRWTFWCVAFLSLLILQAGRIPDVIPVGVAQVAFVVGGLGYFVLSQVIRFYLVPRAERGRRRQLLSDAFAVPLSDRETRGYYNNDLPPSLERLGASVMENAFFSKSIAGVMLRRERLVLALYVLVWTVALASRHGNVGLVVWVTQVVFSTEVVARWLSLEYFNTRSEAAYEQLTRYYAVRNDRVSSGDAPTILESVLDYEVAKGRTSVQLSSSIFDGLNPSLTAEWDKVRRRLRV